MANGGPPLRQSEWVLQNKKILAKILLKGMVGPLEVNERSYQPTAVMPGLGENDSIDDEEIAAVASYIRNAWGNSAEIISAEEVAEVRQRIEARKLPYRAEELRPLL